MSILEELNALIAPILPIETGVFSGKAPDEYVVLTPLAEDFALHCDNRPEWETQEVRLSLYCRGNYLARKRQLLKALLQAGFTITDRRYIGREDDTKYFHQTLDCTKIYNVWEE
jgi:hypothetical protein